MSKYSLNEIIEQSKAQNDERYWKNYGWLKAHSEDPIMGGYFRAQMNKLEAEENERYWNDYFRNTGINRNSVKYPIRAGLYSGIPTGNEAFESSQAVMKLYKRWW